LDHVELDVLGSTKIALTLMGFRGEREREDKESGGRARALSNKDNESELYGWALKGMMFFKK